MIEQLTKNVRLLFCSNTGSNFAIGETFIAALDILKEIKLF